MFHSKLRTSFVATLLVGIVSMCTTTSNAACNGYVGITFDDGPTSNTTTLINLLKQNNLTPVTWFNWGQHVDANRSLVPQELTVGEVQNHSYTHPHMANYTYQQVYNELSQDNTAIQNAGAPRPTLYRAPYGELNATIRQAASDLGLYAMTWDIDSGDWNGASTAAIVSANNQLQNGQVILMHDGYANTNNAITQIASNLRAKNLCPGRIVNGRAVAPAGGGGGSSSSSSSSSSSGGSSGAVTLNSWQANQHSSGLNIWTGGVGNFTAGAWIEFNSVNISGKKQLSFNLASTASGSFKVTLDSTSGTQICTLNYSSTGSWSTYNNQSCTLNLNGAGGSHNLYITDVSGAANLGTLTLQ